MKFKFIYTFFSLSLLAFIFMSNEDGRAESQGKGNTGAPGDEMVAGSARTCVSCHNGSTTIQMTQAIEVLDATGTPISSYTPGTTYRLKVTSTVAAGSPMGYGFQTVCLVAAAGVDGSSSNSFSNPADNVQIAIANSNGRQYAEHSGVSAEPEFEVDWTAPAQGSGPVTFYACGNAVNANGMNSGDGAACSSPLELAEGDPSSVIETNGGVKIFLFPNPVQDVMKVRLLSDASADFDMTIFDMQGRLMKSETISFIAGENNFIYNVNDLAKGTYLVKFSNAEMIATAKLLKL